jgi:Peptidase family M1 domain
MTYSAKTFFITLLLGLLNLEDSLAQSDRWQQKVDYNMTIDMDVKTHQYAGKQRLVYTNNSPDTLTKVFYHLYFNAFQPGSMMDVRSRTIDDADPRVSDRISKLKPEEYGWIKVNTLTQNGKALKSETNETILEVTLDKPILPKSSVTFEMTWDAQVPMQIRRSGRYNREGVAYSMAQWYPKLCEYDYQGWHSNPYIAREFHGVWGDFDVTINIDRNFVVAAGGYLQNPDEVGCGYETDAQKLKIPSGDKLRWHFKTPNVHDFMWAADPEYIQKKITAEDGTTMRFFYKKDKKYSETWEKLPAIMSRARTHMNRICGVYPYREYYFIQGGDGGMEYPLGTLITGDRPINSLVGVSVHEQLHSWYQMILGTNESLYGWMDEGFTSWAETLVMNELAREGLLSRVEYEENPFEGDYRAYVKLATSGKEEPLTTHADHFHTNYAYGTAAYVKGAVALRQLGYVIGDENLSKGMLRYYHEWKFKHPNVNDFIRIMEKQSGLELDWYREDWVNSINTINYGIKSVKSNKEGTATHVVIRREGRMAMPLDILVTYEDGSKELFYAPLESMRGAKPAGESKYTLLPDHRWVDLQYEFDIPKSVRNIKSVQIDPTHRIADIDLSDNEW